MKITDFKKAKVLCIGDVMLDRFIYGNVERISPEAPVPIIKLDHESTMLGGCGNVVRNISALDAKSYFISVVGDDDSGIKIKNLLEEDGIITNMIIDKSRPTTVKSRYIANGQHLIRVDSEIVSEISDDIQKEIFKSFLDFIPFVNILILSDYKKGVLTKKVTKHLISMAKSNNITIIVDPKGKDYSQYYGATIITPNLKELHEATNLPVSTEEEIHIAASLLIEKYNFQNVLITRSQDGMSLLTTNGDFSHLTAKAHEVFDVSGAGDTVVATLATAISANFSVFDAATVANIAAGIVVGKTGTAVVYPDELSKKI